MLANKSISSYSKVYNWFENERKPHRLSVRARASMRNVEADGSFECEAKQIEKELPECCKEEKQALGDAVVLLVDFAEQARRRRKISRTDNARR
jgi:hypothetical protein